jgi:hypothetical protein
MTQSSQRRPLGLRSEASVGQRELQSLRVIASWDLTPIRERLLRTGATSPGRVDEIILEFRRYLGLRAVYPQAITMFSDDVDEVWHTCLIFTRMYADLCQAAFGRFLHHEPAIAPEVDPIATWREFEGAYLTLFGELASVWEMWRPVDRKDGRYRLSDADHRRRGRSGCTKDQAPWS